MYIHLVSLKMTGRIILDNLKAKRLIEYLEKQSIPTGFKSEQRRVLVRSAKPFSVSSGKLFYTDSNGKKLSVIPDDDLENIQRVLAAAHLPNHSGVNKMWMYISERYAGFRRVHVDEFIKACANCSHHQPLKVIDEIKPIIANLPWERVQMDCVDM